MLYKSSTLALTTGTRIGPYEIKSPLGEGGMGVVWRARDLKLQRDVALKLLPDHFADDSERLARLQREAQVLASLNNSNIAQVFGLEESDGRCCIVMELVEGDTLQQRLRRGLLPIDEALAIAKQITEALEAAHERGVIHRDLKPANIKLTSDGQVKVLDFGLAKSVQEQQPASLSNSPTVVNATGPGVILGTAAYMSPEQAKGRLADRTSDIWAFGCVLYEMLTGRAAFEGETASEILAGVMKTEPEWHLLPVEAPASIRRLLRRCLQKDRRARLQHIGDARIEIDEASTPSELDGRQAQRRTTPIGWIVALVSVLVLVGIVIMWFRQPAPRLPGEVRFEFTTPQTSDPYPVSLAISPDGQQVVFVGTSNGQPQLFLRSLNSVSTRPVPGTEGGFYPFWSPDSRSIGFFTGGKLKRVDIDGGLIRALANAPNPVGGTWNRDGTILFTPNYTGPIFRTSANGDDAVALTRVEGQEASHRYPRFLPDGRHFLYYIPSSVEVRGVYVGSLAGGPAVRLLDADAPASYVASQHLLFVREGRLIAQQFDAAKLALSGNPFPVADQVVAANDSSAAGVATSDAGPIAYRAGLATGQRQYVWFDRAGKEIGIAGNPDALPSRDPAMSPDGRRIGFHRTTNGNTDVWLFDLVTALPSRFTFDTAADSNPVWSPDGSTIVFNSNRKGVYDIYKKPANGNGSEELLLATSQNKAAVDWSPDGRFVLFRSPSPTTGFDLWVLPMPEGKNPFPVVQTPFEERDGQFSPDGKWIAYQSNESGRPEILVQPFPGPGGKLQVSTNGGAQVRWRPDGKELFYIGLDGRLMAVPIGLAPNKQSLEAGVPMPLFLTNIGGAIQGAFKQQYIVSKDGQRFLMNSVVTQAVPSPVTVILNWQPKQ
jgi:eukaryotic-like serine/threonine-protein kinase